MVAVQIKFFFFFKTMHSPPLKEKGRVFCKAELDFGDLRGKNLARIDAPVRSTPSFGCLLSYHMESDEK